MPPLQPLRLRNHQYTSVTPTKNSKKTSLTMTREISPKTLTFPPIGQLQHHQEFPTPERETRPSSYRWQQLIEAQSYGHMGKLVAHAARLLASFVRHDLACC